ncbi:MAG: RHS repeat protein, partial [Isosphaeraceae bacterium]|nr:RHS repeat protein [Isosphaeraceae bacterium]
RYRGRGGAHEKPCGSEAQPINLMTGAYFDQFLDYELEGPIPLVWKRYYDSRWSARDGPLGWGFRHEYQFTLRPTLDGFDLVTNDNEVVPFPPLDGDEEAVARDGLLLRRLERPGWYAIEEDGQPAMVFQLGADGGPAPLQALRLGEHWMEFRYEDDGRLAEICNSLGRSIRLLYDARGHILQLTCREAASGQERLLASYAYDPAGLLVRWRDALGHDSTYHYDANRRMTSRTNRRGYSFFNEYDSEGRCTREYGEDGLWDCRVEYLPEAHCAIATYADGATTTVFYDENQIPTEVIEPSRGRTIFEKDDQGRIVREIDPLGNVTRWVYNGWGGHIGRVTPQGFFLPPMDVEPNPPDPLAYELPETPL